MALTVETGAGLAAAESYASAADADAYHQARGHADWTGEIAAKEAALRRATEYLDGAYRTRWAGQLATLDQALAWPRAYVPRERGYFASDKLPVALVRACCECALREIVSPGSLAPDVTVGDRVISETVDVLEVEYAEPQGAASVADVLPRLVAVDRLLAPILRSLAGACLVLRA